MDKMSDVLSAVSQSGFKQPNTPQRERDLAIALYYGQLAWNRANGSNLDKESIKQVRQEMGIPKKLPSSFRVRETNKLLELMVRYKEQNYPDDQRIILTCCFEGERLRVQWREKDAQI